MWILPLLPILSVATEIVSYRFYQSDSQAFYDYSRHDHHAVNGLSLSTEPIADAVLSTFGALFSSAGTVVTLPPNDINDQPIVVSTAFTMIVWVYPSALSGTLISRTDNSDRLLAVELSTSSIQVSLMSETHSISLPSLSTNTWQMIAVAIDCSTLPCVCRTVWNAAAAADALFAGGFTDSPTAKFALGLSVAGGLQGLVYEFRWFDAALGLVDISAFLIVPTVPDPCSTLYTVNPTPQCLPVVTATSVPPTACPATCTPRTCEMRDSNQCFFTQSNCHQSCFTCFGPTSTDCDTCSDPRMTLTGGTCTCPIGYYPLTPSQCSECYFACKACSAGGDDGCTDCNFPATLSAGKRCECPSGSYMTATAACKACSSLCATCNSPQSCLSCGANANIVDFAPFGECVCAVGFYGPANACSACDLVCLGCSGPGVCTSCHPNAEITGSSCSCSPGHFTLSDARSCQQCDSTCSSCIDSASTSCTHCPANAHLLSPPTSGCACDAGFYPDPDSAHCAACAVECKECQSAGSASCTVCADNATLAGTAPAACSCDPGFAGTPDHCQPCSSTCATCSSAFASGCQTCKSHASLVSGTAPSACACDAGFFPSPSPSDCQPCDPTCKRCTGPAASDCAACHPTAHIAPPLSSCICDAGYYPAPTAQSCAQCHSACGSCTGPGAACVTCADPSITPVGGFCACASNQYLLATGLCGNCDESCKTCSGSGPLSCSACYDHATFLAGSGCACIPGFSGPAHNCVQCSPQCLTCSVPTVCLSCKTHAHFQPARPGVCVCLDGFFPNPDPGNCDVCDVTCKRCSAAGPLGCVECYSDAKLQATNPSTCVCDIGFMPQPDSSACVPCAGPCSSCDAPSSPSSCTSCYPHAQLSAPPPSTCHCALGYYPSPTAQVCVACPGLCASCTDGSGACGACKEDAVAAGSSCSCGTGYYLSPDATTCLKCHFTCGDCVSGKGTDCTSCERNSSLAGPSPSACACISGFTRDNSTLKCVAAPCAAGCVSCSPAGTCLGCSPRAQLSQGRCDCVAGFFPSPTAANCEACSGHCLECVDASLGGCRACRAFAELTAAAPSACRCLAGYFPQPDAGHCSACPPHCSHCEDFRHCVQCATGHFLSGEFCLRCPQDCFHCETALECSECAPGFHLTVTYHCKSCTNCSDPLTASVYGPTENRYTITFNRQVATDISPIDITVRTVPAMEFLWEADFSNGNLTLTVTEGDWRLATVIVLSFLIPVKDEFGFLLSNSDLALSPPFSNATAGADSSDYSSSSMERAATASTAAGVAVFSGATVGSGTLALLLLSQMQYFSYISVAEFPVADSLSAFYSNLNQKSTLPNFFQRDYIDRSRRLTSLSESLESEDYLDSIGQYITLLAVISCLHAIVSISAVGCGSAVLEGLKRKVWGAYFYCWVYAFLDLEISALQQLNERIALWSDLRTAVCNVLATVTLIVATATPIYIVAYLRRNALIPPQETFKRQRFSYLTSTYRFDSRWAKYTYALYFAQRLLYSFIIVFARDSPIYQSLLLLIPCGLMTAFTIVVRPLTIKSMRAVHIIGEIDSIAVYTLLCLTCFHPSKSSDISWVAFALTVKSFLCTALLALIDVIANLRECCKRRRQLSEVAPAPKSIWTETCEYDLGRSSL